MALKMNRNVFDMPVRIKVSGEGGKITGFCQHQRCKQPQFFVEYTAGDGRATEAWFFEDQIEIST